MTVLVGRNAPDFTSAAVLADGSIQDAWSLSQETEGKYTLIFFYPLDFTFVCPTELVALDKAIDAFKNRGIEVVAVSIDSQFSHHAWRSTPVEQGGIGPVRYTMVADVSHRICQAYGVEHPEAGIAFRGAFLIDKSGVVRSQIVNDLPLGRNVSEILRLFDAIEFTEKHGEVCPANWEEGKEALKPTQEGVANYLKDNEE